MTEITQADREMAAHVFMALDADQLDTASLQIFFARHREQAEQDPVAKIVAWLRTQNDPSEKWALQNSHWYADAIEAEEWK